MIEGRKEMREMDKPLLVKTMLPPEVTAKMLEALKPVYDALDAADTDTKYKGGSVLIEMGKSGFTNAIFIIYPFFPIFSHFWFFHIVLV